jgi:hypothetical protein
MIPNNASVGCTHDWAKFRLAIVPIQFIITFQSVYWQAII